MHGVTTVVSGNCGVGFAPVRPGKEQWLIELMEGVEDIPGSALAEGITWEWESFPEYLDAIEKRHLAVDFGTQIAHGAVRGYAMGERGDENLHLLVRDDGIGGADFDKGSGLLGLKDRVEALSGQLTLSSTIENGMSPTATIPLRGR